MSLLEDIKEGLGKKLTDFYEHSAKRIYCSANPRDIKEIAGYLFNDLRLRFAIATGQDTPDGLEILYHFSHDKTGQIFSVRVLIADKKNPQIDSIATLFPGAEWIEREIWEMLGINFKGHPNLKRLLLADEFPQGNFPLRHDHKHEEEDKS